MNFYDKHIGDFIRDTVGLSMMEDGAYNRLLDQLYQTERALPLDKKEVYRMARATNPAERKAVDYVLAKFFLSNSDGYTQKRAQAQIEEYWDREPAAETKKVNAKIRQQRSRERRKVLFDQLRDLGITPAFNASMKVLEAELSRVTKGTQSLFGHDPVTRDDTLTQTPDTTTQSPVLKTRHDDAEDSNREQGGETPPTDASLSNEKIKSRTAEVADLLAAAGIRKVLPDHELVTTWSHDVRVTDQVLATALASAKKTKGTAPIPLAYLKPIVAELLAKPINGVQHQSDPGHWRQSAKGIEAMGKSVGLDQHPNELHRDYAVRIEAELANRKGQP